MFVIKTCYVVVNVGDRIEGNFVIECVCLSREDAEDYIYKMKSNDLIIREIDLVESV